jgi:hypothetical protein
MISREEPYMECNGSTAEIKRHVAAKIYPRTLSRVNYKPARDFISLCLLPVNERLSAQELLQHSFLEIVAADDEEVKLGEN